jgi:hypothetical protein
MQRWFTSLCVLPLVLSTNAFAQRVVGEFERLLSIPAACQGQIKLQGPIGRADCNVVASCVRALTSQVTAGIEYAKSSPTIFQVLRSERGYWGLPVFSELEKMAAGLQKLRSYAEREFTPPAPVLQIIVPS